MKKIELEKEGYHSQVMFFKRTGEVVKDTLFFFLKKGDVILWDYEKHQQYKLEKADIDRLMDIAAGKPIVEDDITHHLREEGLIVEEKETTRDWGWDELSWIFHQGTKNPPRVESDASNWFEVYLQNCAGKEVPKETLPPSKEEGIPLSPVNKDLFHSKSLYDACQNRMTSRSFSCEKISFDVFSSLLGLAFSYGSPPWKKEKNYEIFAKHKISPSAGGLHPFEFYLHIHQVENITPGIYKYNPETHHLYPLETGDFRDRLVQSLIDQDYAKDLSFGVFFVADFSKVWWKYEHSRAYRHIYLDAGHQSQSFLLLATSLGLLTWLTGAIQDSEVEELLGLKNEKLSPILFVGIGTGKPNPFNEKIISSLKSKG